MTVFISARRLAWLATAGLLLAGRAAEAGITPYVVAIDARRTTLPVDTGISMQSTGDDIVFYAEGAIRTMELADRFDGGWFGPAGQAGFESSAQPILGGMPYGALVHGTSTQVASYQFMGRMGSVDIQPSDVGETFRLALNLPLADLTAMEGSIVVNIFYIHEGDADIADLVLDRTSTFPVGTGLIGEVGYDFIVLPYGAIRDPGLTNPTFSNGWFGPGGLLGMPTPVEPAPGATYGALLGRFVTGATPFNIGDGGSWTNQPSDVGLELRLFVNMTAAASAAMEGSFHVIALKVEHGVLLGVEDPEGPAPSPVRIGPNPSPGRTSIAFALDETGWVNFRIYDARGRHVRSLVDEPRAAGEHELAWDGRDDAGRDVAEGAYYYQLSTERGSRSGSFRILR